MVIDREGYATAYDYGDVFDQATSEVRYSTRVPQYTPSIEKAGALDVRALAATTAAAIRAKLEAPSVDASAMRVDATTAGSPTGSATKDFGSFAAGDTVTVAVWFRADSLSQAALTVTAGSVMQTTTCYGISAALGDSRQAVGRPGGRSAGPIG